MAHVLDAVLGVSALSSTVRKGGVFDLTFRNLLCVQVMASRGSKATNNEHQE